MDRVTVKHNLEFEITADSFIEAQAALCHALGRLEHLDPDYPTVVICDRTMNSVIHAETHFDEEASVA